MRARIEIGDTLYRVEVHVLAGPDPYQGEDDGLASWIIFEDGQSWDPTFEPRYFVNDFDALRDGIEYLLDGIQSRLEEEEDDDQNDDG